MLANPVAHESGASFPSGHAQAAVVGYAVLLLLFLPVLHGAMRRVAICVAVLGVHYVSDVLAGYLLGAAWVAAMIASFEWSFALLDALILVRSDMALTD